MYQVTAVYMDAEVAYSEADSYEWARDEVIEELQAGPYTEVLEDVMLHSIAPNGMRVSCPAVL